MFRYLFRKLYFSTLLSKDYSKGSHAHHSQQAALSHDLKINLDLVKTALGIGSDIAVREFAFGNQGGMKAAIIFLKGMTDKKIVNESIIRPLMVDIRSICQDELVQETDIDKIEDTMLSAGDVEKVTSIDDLVDGCMNGRTILLINGSNQALLINAQAWETRGVEEPKTESVVRGPREGFTESLLTNITLLRRKIKNANFSSEEMVIGKQTRTRVGIVYLKAIVNPKLIEEIKRRLKRIDTDAILESGYIEQFIEDAPFSIFATIANSEKPDIVASKLLEGRAAILVDGTPFVLTVPMLFVESFQIAEDYYSRPYFTSLIRMLRFISFTVSILAPATYVALTTFHQELVPTPLLLTMAAAREGTPFPAAMEAGIMMIIFEILREAGVRLPRNVGQAISIVGALVIGEAAVSAGLIGAPMVIVVAITAVASFVVPAQTDSVSILRIILLILAGFMGGIGILAGLIGLFIHLASLRSFGTPYLSPVAPLTFRDLKDVFIRAPLWSMFTRPRTIGWHDPERQNFRLRPGPASDEGTDSEE